MGARRPNRPGRRWSWRPLAVGAGRDRAQPETVYVGLGANLGDRLATMIRAVEVLSDAFDVVACSSVYETEPVGYVDQPDFLNMVVAARTLLEPDEVLRELKRIETELGRAASNVPGGPRLIDLDLLFHGERHVASPLLTVPHPRAHERAFVLVPLAEIAADFVHPMLRQTTSEMARLVGGLGGTAPGVRLFRRLRDCPS